MMILPKMESNMVRYTLLVMYTLSMTILVLQLASNKLAIFLTKETKRKGT